MVGLNIEVSNPLCCLCDAQTMEDSTHFFYECAWFKPIIEDLMLWTNVQIHYIKVR